MVKENVDIYFEYFERFLIPCDKWETRYKNVKNMVSLRGLYIQHYEKARVEFAGQESMIACLDAGKLLQYFNKHERSPAHIAAVVLNPPLKWKVIMEWKEEVKRYGEKTLSRLWKIEY